MGPDDSQEPCVSPNTGGVGLFQVSYESTPTRECHRQRRFVLFELGNTSWPDSVYKPAAEAQISCSATAGARGRSSCQDAFCLPL